MEEQVVNNEGGQPAVQNEGVEKAPEVEVEEQDWRRSTAGDDERLLAHLARYNTQNDAIKAGFELKQKVSSGEYRRNIPFPLDGKPEEQAEWRKENGVPESFDKYEMPEGIVVGENDKPMIDGFLESMHGNNANPAVVKTAIEWYYKTQDEAMAKEAENSRVQKMQTEEALRADFGTEYRPIMNMTENFIKSRFGDIVGEALLASSPEVVKEFANIARELNPSATVVPNSANPMQSIQDEIASLRSQMRDQKSWAKNQKGQARLIDLISAEQSMKK